MSKSIYIAGPMTGYPEFNFPAFHAAAKTLRKDGWLVYNPAEKDEETELDAEAVKTGDAALAVKKGFDFREAYRWDIDCVIKSDGIYLLPGWEKSSGACGEFAVALAVQKHYPDYQILFHKEANVENIPVPVRV